MFRGPENSTPLGIHYKIYMSIYELTDWGALVKVPSEAEPSEHPRKETAG